MNTKINEILQEIESVIVGKNEIVEKILMAILAQGHVLMEDVPGVGKTTTAMAFAKVLGLETRRVQFTSDTVPSDIIGFSVYDKKKLVNRYPDFMFYRNNKRANSIGFTGNCLCPMEGGKSSKRTYS